MEQLLEITGVLVGLVYLALEYKASIYLWIASIIMPIIYLFVFYQAGLYADFAINIYYLLIAIYGWIMWKYGNKLRQKVLKKPVYKKEELELPITRTSRRQWFWLTITAIITFFFITWILIRFTNSNVPWMDSFTTALSIIAMWMLAHKYLEQWIVWIVVDIASAGLYIYKALYLTSALYILYAIIAIFGYIKWEKMTL